MTPWSSKWCVSLIDVKSGFEHQSTHQNKIQKSIFSFSQQIPGKNLGKIAQT